MLPEDKNGSGAKDLKKNSHKIDNTTSKLTKKKVWDLSVLYSGPVDGEVRVNLHHKRKMREVIDYVIEDIQRQIQEGKCKSYLEFGSFFLRYKGEKLDL